MFYLVAAVLREWGISKLSDAALTYAVVVIVPFLPPTNGVGDTPPLPYYLYVILV